MAIPIIGRRREQRLALERETRQAEIDAAVTAGIEKAISPAVAMAAFNQQTGSGATYGVNPSSPFNQLGPGAGFVPLPRPAGVFDSGFGPSSPLFPDAIDPLGPDGRTIPRRAQYLIAANLQLVDRRIPWSVLRGLAEDVDVIARCIQLVQDAIVGLEWSWGFSPMVINQIMTEQDLTNSSKASAIAQDKFGDELQRVSEFFEYPDKKMDQSFSEWLTSVIFSHLVYDGIVVSPSYNLGGELTALSVIDTPTIKILLDNQGFLPKPPAPAYQQILYGFPRGEYQAEGVDRDGNIPNGYREDQLFYKIRRPRADSVYGYSQVEECINIATIYMQRQAWLHAEYSHGVQPKMVVTTEGAETWTPEQLAYYERIYNDQWAGQTQRRQQFMLMRPGMKVQELKQIDEAYKSDYDAWLVMQMGAKFGIPQSLMGIQMHSSIGGGAAGKQQSDQSEQFATDAMRNFLIDCINDMARRFMGVGPELTITATGGGNDEDDLTRNQADQIDVNSGIRSRNEIRSERGIPLDPSPEADQLSITIATGVQYLTGTLEGQQKQQELAANPPPPPEPKVVVANPDGTIPSDDSGSSDKGPATPPADAKPAAKPAAADDTKAPSDITPKDDARQPDAESAKELAAFAKWAKSHLGKDARPFEFKHQGPVRAEQLNEAVKTGDYELVKAAMEKPRPKGKAQQTAGRTTPKSDWASQPHHPYHDAIVAHWAPKLAAALKNSIKNVGPVITSARSKYDSTKKAAGDGTDTTPSKAAATGAVAGGKIAPSSREFQEALQGLMGDAYLTGTHAAALQLGGGVNLTGIPGELEAAVDWDSWEPGEALPAELVSSGAWQAVLDQMDITISSVTDTTLERLTNALANGLAAGDSNDTIANSIADMVSGNADMIANTETARAQFMASQSVYGESGIGQWNWLNEDDSCPICQDNADEGPYDVDDGPSIPEHPSCRCAPLAVVTDADGNDLTSTDDSDQNTDEDS